MKKKIAWLTERGQTPEDNELYNTMLPKYDIDFFDHPSEVQDNMNNGYDLFVIGLYVSEDNFVSYPLIDAIKANEETKGIPILIRSTVSDLDHHKLEIEERDVEVINVPHRMDQLRKKVESLI